MSRPTRPTFPPPSRGGAPEWAQYRPDDTRVPASLLSQEANALRRLSPRKNRWPEVAAFDERIRATDEQQARLSARAVELNEQIRRAETTDREALAACVLDTSKARPVPAAPGLEAEREETLREADALALAQSSILEEKAAFVEKHRKRLIKDAEKATVEHRKSYDAAIAAAEKAREELAESRSAVFWAATYPSEAAIASVPTSMLAAGLRGPVEKTLGLASQVSAVNVFAALLEDAQVLASVGTEEQLAALGRPASNAKQALWQGSPEAIAREREEKKAARERIARELGFPPPRWK